MEADLRAMKSFSQQKTDAVKYMPEAQSLIRMLNEQNGVLMEQVMKAIQCGDYTKARQLLQPAMDSKQVQDTLREIGNKLG